jgi:hypothetical protein
MTSLEPIDGLLAELAASGRRLILICGMGFEDRGLSFLSRVASTRTPGLVVGVRYLRAAAKNREREFVAITRDADFLSLATLGYSQEGAPRLEIDFDRVLRRHKVSPNDVVVLDVSGLTKFLILVLLLRLWSSGITVKVVLTTALHYSPTREDFERTMSTDGGNVRIIAGQPSSGASAILRSTCLISPRMQGQPVCAVAFTSFNEELIRHAIGTINPHRLILINGLPPAESNLWRASATQAIHARLIAENAVDNPVSQSTGLLLRTVSTFDFREALTVLEGLHAEIGLYERMMYFATGSKMQTVALAVHKLRNRDVHIEYPTPSGYFFKEYSSGADKSFFVSLDPGALVEESLV